MCNVAAVEYISSSTFCLQSVYRIYWNNLHAFYLHKFVKAHHMRFVSLQSVQCTKNQNSGLLSTRCTICVCELLGDLQTLPRAVTQSCLREMGIIRTSQVLRPTCFWKWVGASKSGLGNLASSAPALQGGGTLRELWNHQTTNSSWAAVVPVKSHWGFVMAVAAFGKRNLFQDHRPFAFRLVRY